MRGNADRTHVNTTRLLFVLCLVQGFVERFVGLFRETWRVSPSMYRRDRRSIRINMATGPLRVKKRSVGPILVE